MNKNQTDNYDSTDELSATELRYEAPQILKVGAVEAVTHGSRENTADSGAGYQGG